MNERDMKAFMDERLLELFRQMKLLGITLDDIRKAYENTAAPEE